MTYSDKKFVDISDRLEADLLRRIREFVEVESMTGRDLHGASRGDVACLIEATVMNLKECVLAASVRGIDAYRAAVMHSSQATSKFTMDTLRQRCTEATLRQDDTLPVDEKYAFMYAFGRSDGAECDCPPCKLRILEERKVMGESIDDQDIVQARSDSIAYVAQRNRSQDKLDAILFALGLKTR